jgi:hypothetical protein
MGNIRSVKNVNPILEDVPRCGVDQKCAELDVFHETCSISSLASDGNLADVLAGSGRVSELAYTCRALAYRKAVKKPDTGRFQVELRPTERLPVLWHARPSENLTV